jgi:hypothetical protein
MPDQDVSPATWVCYVMGASTTHHDGDTGNQRGDAVAAREQRKKKKKKKLENKGRVRTWVSTITDSAANHSANGNFHDFGRAVCYNVPT